ncbi:MAG: ATP-binding protein [Hylemonella sp.]|nr:ATP-binding protein [Hylemonella sp.]
MSRVFDIRQRMLLAALLPVSLVALLLSSVFLMGRLGDIDAAHTQRARMLARQLASASEYGIFSANIGSLQALAASALREPDVRSVVVLGDLGQVYARAGKAAYPVLPALGASEREWRDERSGNDIMVQPVTASRIQLDEIFEQSVKAEPVNPQLLGHVVIEVSRKTLQSHERDMLYTGLFVTISGLLLGAFLALRIGHSVIQPVLRVSRMIERISAGELSARVSVRPDDPLHDLQIGLNQMAERLEQGRDELEQRVEQATLALRQKKEEAEAATMIKSRFLAAASHDLRQPTHALGMFVARLGQLRLDEEARRLVMNLDAAVLALQDLLDALLDLSRLEAQAVHVDVRAFPMDRLLEQLQSALAPAAVEKGLRLRVRPCSAWIMSDPVLLQRILLNLVSNALRYTRQGGVLLACRRVRGGSHLRIEVWDSGVGIAGEHQKDIFREFFQVGNVERDRSRGLGLGLSIVERTARLLGHPLALCSRPGQGSRFSVEVPVTASVEIPGTPQDRAALRDDIDGVSVLVVEDDRMVSRALQELLSSWGCRVVVAEGVLGALHAVRSGFEPEVLLCDYRLRDGATGLDAIALLREALARPVPACLMSGDTDSALMILSREAGLPLLHKPVRPGKLRVLIRRLARSGDEPVAVLDQLKGDGLA